MKEALVNLRRVKALKPPGPKGSILYAEWREQIGQALLLIAAAPPDNGERRSAQAEAEAAFAEGARIRAASIRLLVGVDAEHGAANAGLTEMILSWDASHPRHWVWLRVTSGSLQRVTVARVAELEGAPTRSAA